MFFKGIHINFYLFSVLYPSNTAISEAIEDLPGPAGYDGEAGWTHQAPLWDLPRQRPRSLVQEWTANPTQWPPQHHSQK